jgi:DNA polymerase V
VILSNNDGCVIARSNEAKALEFLSAPVSEYKNILLQTMYLSIRQLFRTRYEFLSNEISLATSFPEIEIYSIDEAPS